MRGNEAQELSSGSRMGRLLVSEALFSGHPSFPDSFHLQFLPFRRECSAVLPASKSNNDSGLAFPVKAEAGCSVQAKALF